MDAIILIIGEEILSGQTTDRNIPFLTKKLFEQGIKVKEIRVLPDVLETIVPTIQWAKTQARYIFITGGIGGTHDDVTRKAIALALNKKFDYHSAAREYYEKLKGAKLSPYHLESTKLPEGSKLVIDPRTKATGFEIENVFCFPGFPEMVEGMFESIQNQLIGEKFYKTSIACPRGESVYGDYLTQLAMEMPEVSFGSYPHLKKDQSGFTATITITSRKESLVKEAAEKITAYLKSKNII